MKAFVVLIWLFLSIAATADELNCSLVLAQSFLTTRDFFQSEANNLRELPPKEQVSNLIQIGRARIREILVLQSQLTTELEDLQKHHSNERQTRNFLIKYVMSRDFRAHHSDAEENIRAYMAALSGINNRLILSSSVQAFLDDDENALLNQATTAVLHEAFSIANPIEMPHLRFAEPPNLTNIDHLPDVNITWYVDEQRTERVQQGLVHTGAARPQFRDVDAPVHSYHLGRISFDNSGHLDLHEVAH